MKLWAHLAAALLVPSTFIACGEDRRGGGHPSSYCDDFCECEQCSDAEHDACEAQLDSLESEADLRGCRRELDVYVDCVNAASECDNGRYVMSSADCQAEEGEVSTCFDGPGCATVGDGQCDEPEGTGLCPEGTDPVDCIDAPCPSTNNGQCDEPEGTGLCPDGTDIADCNCPYTNNGQCDEPEGTGLCPEGTDAFDCVCPYTNNGQCDEPEGTGLCPEGTDFVDCHAPQGCDDGDCGDAQSGCLGCALADACAAELVACQDDPSGDCIAYVQCIDLCQDQACADQCAADHPGGATLYNDLVFCAICEECPVSCNGAGSGCP